MNEKMQKLEQEKRKLEEALARNKEAIRKQRTHRLVQIGAILEKAYPPAKDMPPEELQEKLIEIFGKNEDAGER